MPGEAERQPVGGATVLAALVLLAFVVFMTWLHHTASRVEDMAQPERALAVVVGRTLDLDDAVDGAPTWERRIYRTLLGDAKEDLAQAILWYDELEAVSLDPDVDLHAAILEGEAGRLDRLRRRVTEWEQRGGDFPEMAGWLVAAYLGGDVDVEAPPGLAVELGATLPSGWFHDRLAARLAARSGDLALAAAARGALAERERRLLWRLRGLLLIEAAILVLGTLALARIARWRGAGVRAGSATLPPPWSGRAGVVVLVRGGALGAVLMTAFYLVPMSGPGRDVLRVAVATAANLAFVPVIVLARRHLLHHAGLGLLSGFGLRPARRDVWTLAAVLFAVLAVGQAGEWALGLAARTLDVSSHWTEWFEPDLAWGSAPVVALTLVDVVGLTPVFEEILFRGLLFATLRRGLGMPTAAVASAGIFAVAHGYGVLGFASVFWSAVLWAWAYEKTGSLWPGIAAHAADNLGASLSVLLVLRG